MVPSQLFTLNLEHILRVADVLHQISRHFRIRFHGAVIDFHPCLQQWIFWFPGIEGHRTVVGVYGRFDRVADVVHLTGQGEVLINIESIGGSRFQLGLIRVWESIRGGVPIYDPLNFVVNDSRVGVGIHFQIRCHFFNALHRIAVEENL